MDVKLSVIIPVYNAEKYIGTCLDSLIAQTLQKIEIICVDDGSTDDSLEIMRRYALRDRRIMVIHQDNQGANAARKAGYMQACGEFITLVDADDWVEKDIYEVVVGRMRQENADCAIFNWYIENQAGGGTAKCKEIKKEYLCIEQKWIEEISLAGLCGGCNPVAAGRAEGWPWNKVYKRIIFEKLNHDGKLFADETRHFEDALNNIRLFRYVNRLLLLNKYGYHYRKGNEMSITTKYYRQLPSRQDFLHYMRFVEENSMDGLCCQVMATMVVNLFWDYICQHHYFRRENEDSFWKQRKEIERLLAGCYTEECYFPIRQAIEGANADWIGNRAMRFLVRHHMVSAFSLYAGSRISLLKNRIMRLVLQAGKKKF